MPAAWRSLAAKVDAAINSIWGEPVDLLPRVPPNYSDVGTFDTSRAAVLGTVGVYMRPGSIVTGQGGSASGTFSTRVQESDWWLSIAQDDLKGLELRKDDLVFFPDRGEYGAVSFVEPSATARPNVHLIAVPPAARPAPQINVVQSISLPTQDAEGRVS